MSPRERVFIVLAAALPFVALAFVEGVVRMAWPAGATPLFTETVIGGESWMVANRGVAARWFPGDSTPPSPSAQLFRREKPEGGIRLFVLGESAAQGFPYPRHGAFSRVLAQMLADAMPGVGVEVINVGIAATNSFSMLDIVDEVLEHSPDAILYYGGHNEYYGAYGPGSTVRLPGAAGMTRALLAAQRLRSIRLVNHLVARARAPAPTDADPAAAASFMDAVARDRAIELDGPVYAAGVTQYEGNLVRIVRRARRVGVPVYLSSVASNMRDQAPFASPANEQADSAFALGARLLAAGDTAPAREAFRRARDLDVIRFRAPSAFADVTARVSEAEGAVWVPVHAAFERAAPSGLPGRDLFLEHVHPTQQGADLVARAFLDALAGHPLPGTRPDLTRIRDASAYAADRGFTDFDERIALHRVNALTQRWPFVAPSAQGDYFGAYAPTDAVDSLAFMVAAGALPWERAKIVLAGLLERAGDLDGALANYRAVRTDVPTLAIAWRLEGEALWRAGRLAAADSSLATAMRIAPTLPLVLQRAQLASADRRWADAVRLLRIVLASRPNDPEVLYRMSLASALAGDTTAARSTAERLARVAPEHPAYRDWLRMFSLAP